MLFRVLGFTEIVGMRFAISHQRRRLGLLLLGLREFRFRLGFPLFSNRFVFRDLIRNSFQQDFKQSPRH